MLAVSSCVLVPLAVVRSQAPRVADRVAPAANSRAADSSATARPPRKATESTRADTVPPTPAPAAKSDAPPLIAGLGALTLSGELQIWYTAGSGVVDNSFRLRRADLRVSGVISPMIAWTLQVDAAKTLAVNSTYTDAGGKTVLADQSISQSSRLLQDAFVTFTRRPSLRILVGQFRIPFSYEGAVAVSRIDAVEQPMFVADRTRGGGIAQVRDIGVMAAGGFGKRFEYRLGAFNGSGESQNATDRNDEKSIVARALVRPMAGGLRLGASAVFSGPNQRERRDRSGAEVQYRKGRLTARSEYVRAVDGLVHREGLYYYTGVRVRKDIELLARYDLWDPDTRADGTAATAAAREVLVGVTKWLQGDNAKLQLNLAHRDFGNAALKSVPMLLAHVQVSW